jgi:hypothetical protein
MKILFFGDVVGRPGRTALTRLLPDLKTEYGADLVLANVENMAHGFGITPETIAEVKSAGVDVCTSGNHAWKNLKGVQLLREEPTDMIVPQNVRGMPGLGITRWDANGISVLIVNLLGQAFMNVDHEISSPFGAIDGILEEEKADVVIVDFHAEATGEKRCMSWHLDGRASLLVGTHTHIQTSDNAVLPEGLGYITDLGMTGAVESSLGMDKNMALRKVAQQQETHLEPPTDFQHVQLQGILADIDPQTGKALSIERIDRKMAV